MTLHKIPSDRERRYRKRLIDMGLKIRDVAQFLGVSDQAVSQVIKGLDRSERIEAVLKDPRKIRRYKRAV
jgi:predicted transcriptional regulator